MADPINANPTILNPSDLPTRRRRPSSTTSSPFGGISLFSSVLPPSSSAIDPFDNTPLSSFDSESSLSDDDDAPEPIDEQEIYDLIAPISDPEHPLTLGSLGVVLLPDIHITPTLPSVPFSPLKTLTVYLTPTINHCSLATVIGLGVRVRLEQALPPRFRVDVRIKEGSHAQASDVNRQLGDKERVAAALENGTLRGVVGNMLKGC
ncbi:MAG: hypothetical protein M1834_002698 [Cirrosporium novae-zelandiae]|nr:MAG: hypothetical protein M1834_002698 [Cirrosporium novae-zelandiae]